ncbi:DUF1254 domain-containing protein [Coraliomargarita akajimensis]|uniref:DUF1254 domain-containing protein n=1 Tax=Coraliomargarita akajimensis (strain DSM 45221 / IAM 15411 / JCM 23193 / KCTC 12865 / 04OKA010-24) TaxID=583355 RepID=D5EJX0_CORAD|nr:DUF1254 domain-containing protein [Coraliomargarita akajimensis]ADE54719.1 protein of unknown function DUF1214 [Coraliomargarita akajimensis DSM 45221]
MKQLYTTPLRFVALSALCASAVTAENYKYTTDIPDGIITPDKVETSIGTLEFTDGVPSRETADKAYDFMDTARAADAFLKGMPAASVAALIEGAHSIGAVEVNQVMLFDGLMNAKSLFLTGNSATVYVVPDLDLKRDGPTVVDAPKGLLGAANDANFRFIQNITGGKYLFLPPDYEGEVPDGYIVLRPKTYRVWVFLRKTPANKSEENVSKAANEIREGLKVYRLADAENPPAMEWISGSDQDFNTIHYNNAEFYDHVNEVIQYETLELLDPEVRGLFASLGIEKGKPFNPDDRMKAILADGVAIGNAQARSIVWYPRIDMNMGGVQIYPDTGSAWNMAYTGRNVHFNGEDGATMSTDARVSFHYPYTAVTPAMAAPRLGTGSDYGIAFLDGDKQPFDGSKTYKITLPPDAPIANFWAVTIYDTQTRSMLQTDQKAAGIDSLQDGLRYNRDGSIDIYFAPKAPPGYQNNWVQTIPGKSWFTILRMYSPLEEWIEQSWRPSEVIRTN